jgi:hypothetical protein
MSRRVLLGVLAVFSGLAVTSVAAQIQRPTGAPIRLGKFAIQLSAQDVADLEQVLPDGAKPWLLFGGDCVFCEVSIFAYLPPTTETSELRRGRILILPPPAGLIKGGIPPSAWLRPRPAPSSWTLTGSSLYAQVAIPGRGFEPLETDRDLHRPFTVMGDFDDAELLSVVGFARSNSRWSGVMELVKLGAGGSVRVARCGWLGAGGSVRVARCGWLGAGGDPPLSWWPAAGSDTS